MKSLVNDLLHVALGILKDVQAAYPEYGGIVRDKARLTRLAKTRGLGVFTLDLPRLDAILKNGLETGLLDAKGTKCSSKQVKVPSFLKGLWLRVFDKHSCLRSDVDTTALAFLSQIFCLGKKIEVGCSPARLKQAVQEYHNVERSTRQPTLKWDRDNLDPNGRGSSIHFGECLYLDPNDLFANSLPGANENHLRILCQRLQRTCDAVAKSLGFFEPVAYSGEIHEKARGIGFKHGPGAVADRRGKFDKYTFPRWSVKLQEWFPFEHCGVYAGMSTEKPVNHEVAARLIAVPKTAKGPRLITAEPTEHQWCQQLIKNFLEERISHVFKGRFIDFKDQEKSQLMVRAASLVGNLVTVDLSSASDRLSCWAIERAFRKNPSVLHALHACRTRWVRDDISNPPIFVKQRKFASQGTAVTFPVQTLFFLCCVLAVLPGRSLKDKIVRYGEQVQVFGDDIILPKDGYADLVILLHYLGLKVNLDKSFSKGLFRESCGMDSYGGDDVTPVKPRSLKSDGPKSRAALLDFTNNLFKKGYWNASKAAESTGLFRDFLSKLPIVDRDSGAIGRTSFCGGDVSHLRKRWNANLQREEVLAWGFTSRVKREPTGSASALLQWFTEAPAPDTKWESGIAERPRTSDGLRWVDPTLGNSVSVLKG